MFHTPELTPEARAALANRVPDQLRALLAAALKRPLDLPELIALAELLCQQWDYAPTAVEAYLLESGVVASCDDCRRPEPACVCGQPTTRLTT